MTNVTEAQQWLEGARIPRNLVHMLLVWNRHLRGDGCRYENLPSKCFHHTRLTAAPLASQSWKVVIQLTLLVT